MPIEARTEQVMIRLTEGELASVERAAKAKGEKVSTAAREVLVRWAKRTLAA